MHSVRKSMLMTLHIVENSKQLTQWSHFCIPYTPNNACEVLKKFNMVNCNATPIPIMVNLKLIEELEEDVVDTTLFKQVVGSIRYLCNSKADIRYGVGLISKFMNEPRTPHMTSAKHILRYLKGTLDLGLFFPRNKNRMKQKMELFWRLSLIQIGLEKRWKEKALFATYSST